MFRAGIVHAYCLFQGGHVTVTKAEENVCAMIIARQMAGPAGRE
jgi:hypothetical protein